MSTIRRRQRLQSSQGPGGRWKPQIGFVVVGLGLLIGLGLGATSRRSDQAASLQQHYFLLASDLYAQGVPLADVNARLVAVGFANPSAAVQTSADELGQATDSLSQQGASQLHQFANVLKADSSSGAGADNPSDQATPAATESPAALSPVATTAATNVTGTAVATVTGASPNPATTAEAASPTPASDVTAPPLPTATPEPPPPTPTPLATAASARPGTVRVSGKSAVLRSGASSKTASVATIPNGAKITVYGSLAGEPLSPPDTTWYHVVYNGKSGYLYANEVKVNG
jgi:hypothetical protein